MALIRNTSNRLKRRGAHRVARAGVPVGQEGVVATSITLSDTVHPRLYQRVGTSKTITVSGTSNGTWIQARACPVGKGLTQDEGLYPYTDLTLSHQGGAFSLHLSVPQGDFWVIQVRDGVNHTLGQTGTHEFGVGMVVALLGQSNMENLFGTYDGAFCGAKGSLRHKSGVLHRLGNVADEYPPNTLRNQYDGTGDDYLVGSYTPFSYSPIETYLTLLTNTLVADLGVPVVIFPHAVSNTSITTWQSGQTSLDAFLTDIDTYGGDFEHVLLLLGESDAATGMSAATYQGHLQTLFNTCKAHAGRASADFSFGVVVVGPATDAWALAAERMKLIRKAQLDFVAANSGNGAYLAGTLIDGNLAGVSSVHVNDSSLRRQACRYVEAIKRRFAGAANNIEGPQITSASRAGAVITVNITHQGGSALLDGVGGSGSSLLGFRVFDGSTPCTISSTAISGNTVILTLSTAPSGVVTMDYAMANAPFGATTTLASVCYDNQTVTGDTLGLPLQPCALMSVI